MVVMENPANSSPASAATALEASQQAPGGHLHSPMQQNGDVDSGGGASGGGNNAHHINRAPWYDEQHLQPQQESESEAAAAAVAAAASFPAYFSQMAAAGATAYVNGRKEPFSV